MSTIFSLGGRVHCGRSDSTPMRELLQQARRVVVKVGTNALTNATGRFHRAHFEQLAQEVAAAAKGREIIVVSSGAIALGVERLQLQARPKDVPGKQACAAVGQSRLMRAWEEALHPRVVAQVLLTHDDMQNRRRYLNARHALNRMLEHRVIPVINENDTVAADEIKVGDNDTLAGLVAGLVGADALVILSDVDGLYDADPRKSPSAQRLKTVHTIDAALLRTAGGSGSAVGTGGMATKVRAAARATELGIATCIVAGHLRGRLTEALAGDEVGTLFLPAQRSRDAREAWLAHALKGRGQLELDEGAARAIAERGKSLLPAGIKAVRGKFTAGDAVELVGPDGRVFARGLVAYSADELQRIKGLRTAQLEAVLGYRGLSEAVHRDDLVLLG